MSHAAMEPYGPTRREFLACSGALMSGTALAQEHEAPFSLPPTNTGPGRVPRKPFGRHNEQLSIIGLGGFSLGSAESYDEAERIVREAIDAGVNFFDNAWEYHEGRSEEWMGRALAGRRDRVLLMTKVCTHGRGADVAMRQLEDSLRRLRTDHVDLWQIHEVVYENDPDLHFARGGAVEALDRARRQGKVRYVGFTGHKDPHIHLRMLSHGYPFDAVQMPLNCFDATFRSFERLVLPQLQRQGIAALGMKSLCGGGDPVLQGVVTVEEALRYAMSLPVATTISGIDSLEVLRQNLGIARDFRPMTADELNALRQRCAGAAADGHLELYKSTVKYDGALGRHQHHFPSPDELPL
jgi:uncharacterized protein